MKRHSPPKTFTLIIRTWELTLAHRNSTLWIHFAEQFFEIWKILRILGMISESRHKWCFLVAFDFFWTSFEGYKWNYKRVILESFQKIFSIQHRRRNCWRLFRSKIVEDFESHILSNCLYDFVPKMTRPVETLFYGSPDGLYDPKLPTEIVNSYLVRKDVSKWHFTVFSIRDTGPDGWIRSCWGVFSSKSSVMEASECAVEYVLFCFGNFPFSLPVPTSGWSSFSISVITDMLTWGNWADFGRNTAEDNVLWLAAPVSVMEAFDWLRCKDSWFSGWSVLGPWREFTDWRTLVFCLF